MVPFMCLFFSKLLGMNTAIIRISRLWLEQLFHGSLLGETIATDLEDSKSLHIIILTGSLFIRLPNHLLTFEDGGSLLQIGAPLGQGHDALSGLREVGSLALVFLLKGGDVVPLLSDLPGMSGEFLPIGDLGLLQCPNLGFNWLEDSGHLLVHGADHERGRAGLGAGQVRAIGAALLVHFEPAL